MDAPLRVLLVEDDLDLAENLAEILQALDYEPVVAHDAEQALAAVAQGRIDGVITDLQASRPGRPGAHGRASAVRLRRPHRDDECVHGPRRRAPGPQRRCAGRAAQTGRSSSGSAALVREFGRPGYRVLIVDDNRDLADNIAEALSAHGLEAIVAGSEREVIGHRALTRVALVDLRLPDASGLEVAERLTARDPRIKILFMTAYDDEARKADGLGGDGPACIEKPFDVEHLVERIRQAANG